MHSTIKTSIAITVLCFFSTFSVHAQTTILSDLKAINPKLNYQESIINVNGKQVSYDSMLHVPDSVILKIEVYGKKEGVKLFGKDGKNGMVLITLLSNGALKEISRWTNHKNYLYNDNGDSIFCDNIVPATLNGDTSHNNWTRFLEKNLRSEVPIDNGCPMGIYRVYFSFDIDTTGTVQNIKIIADPGYDCGKEVKRLMSASPKWATGTCNNQPVNFRQRQTITFMVSEL